MSTGKLSLANSSIESGDEPLSPQHERTFDDNETSHLLP